MARVYRLKNLPSDFHSALPLFVRNSHFSSKLAFYLPFGYTAKADILTSKLRLISWDDLGAFSQGNQTEIVLRSIGALEIERGQLTSNHSNLNLNHNSLEISSNYSKNLRKSLARNKNRAQKMGVSFAVETSKLAIDQFYNLYTKQNLHYHKSLFHPLILFSQLVDCGLAKIYTARINGSLLGGIFVLFDSNTAYYAWGARDTNESLSIHTLLIDMLVRDSISLGLTEVDLGLSPIGDIDLLQYKQQWGANTNTVFTYSTLNLNRVINLKSDFKLIRSMYSRVPIPVAKLITPAIIRAVIC